MNAKWDTIEFGHGTGTLVGAADAAAKHGATLVNDAGRHWFTAPRQGQPWDDRLRKAVLTDPAVVAAKAVARN